MHGSGRVDVDRQSHRVPSAAPRRHHRHLDRRRRRSRPPRSTPRPSGASPCGPRRSIPAGRLRRQRIAASTFASRRWRISALHPRDPGWAGTGRRGAGVRKEDLMDEADRASCPRCRPALRSRSPAQFSRRGKRSAMSSPVKSAAQPSGLVNRRTAQKLGLGPMSNQCRVPAGTLIRSPRSHSTS